MRLRILKQWSSGFLFTSGVIYFGRVCKLPSGDLLTEIIFALWVVHFNIQHQANFYQIRVVMLFTKLYIFIHCWSINVRLWAFFSATFVWCNLYSTSSEGCPVLDWSDITQGTIWNIFQMFCLTLLIHDCFLDFGDPCLLALNSKTVKRMLINFSGYVGHNTTN